jgi:tRNA 2-thiouridine synthesizing protein A
MAGVQSAFPARSNPWCFGYNGGLDVVACETTVNSEQQDDIQHRLDATGLVCPEPVMLLHGKVRAMAPGELLEVIATDPSTERDIPRFCQFLGHSLELHESQGTTFRYLIRKKIT